MGQARERQVDATCSRKSGNPANSTGNAPGTGDARNKTSADEPEYASCATTKAWAAQHSTCSESAAAETDAAFHAANETGSGGQADDAFESVNSAGAQQSVNSTDATIDASRRETQHTDDSACAGTRTQSRRRCAKPVTGSKASASSAENSAVE